MLLDLAAGNEVAEVIHGFPVAPSGFGIRFARPLSVSPTSATAGVGPCRFPGWDGSSGFADEPGRCFVLGPPRVPPATPLVPEVRGAADGPGRSAAVAEPMPPLARFKRSLHITYEEWHDGIGYDLGAIREASPEDLASIEALLLERGTRDWRDVEALAALRSPRAREALRSAMTSRSCQVALAVARHAADLLTESERVALIVRGLEQATFHEGLTQALDQAENHHPAPVTEALLRGAARREPEVAVHFAAMLMFLHGLVETAFDWELRPFFLAFHTRDSKTREAAFRRLCRKVSVEAQTFLKPG